MDGGSSIVPPNNRVAKSRKEIASHFGVTTTAVDKWIDRGLPIGSKGPYDILMIQEWIDANIPNGKSRSSPTNKTSLSAKLTQARVRKTRAQARMAELELKRQQGAWIAKDDVLRREARIAATIKNALLALPRSNAQTLSKISSVADMQEALTQIVHEVLRELSGDRSS